MMPTTEGKQTAIRTDTATLVVFDPARLEHRLDDAPDWWSIPWDDVKEINAGNVLFVSTGVDGDYLVHVYEESPPVNVIPVAVQAVLACDSGSFFVGAGEYVSSGGLRPHTKYGGLFLRLPKGMYRVTVVHLIAYCLDVFVEPTGESPVNAFEDSPCVPWPKDAT